MTVADWITSAVGFTTVLTSGWLGVKGYRRNTRADQNQAHEAIRLQLAEARAEERARLNPVVEEMRRRRDEAIEERNYERARADQLQTLINQWQIGRDN